MQPDQLCSNGADMTSATSLSLSIYNLLLYGWRVPVYNVCIVFLFCYKLSGFVLWIKLSVWCDGRVKMHIGLHLQVAIFENNSKAYCLGSRHSCRFAHMSFSTEAGSLV